VASAFVGDSFLPPACLCIWPGPSSSSALDGPAYSPSVSKVPVYSLRHLESSACRGSLRPGRRAPAHRDDVIEMVAPFLPCLLPCRPCLLLLLRAHERLDEPQPPNARRGAGRRAGGHWVGGIILISIQPALLLALSRKADSNSGREQNLEKSVFSSSSSRPGALQAPTRPTATQTIPAESTMTWEPPEPTFTIEPRGSGCGPWHRPRLRAEHTSRATALLPGHAELSQAARD